MKIGRFFFMFYRNFFKKSNYTVFQYYDMKTITITRAHVLVGIFATSFLLGCNSPSSTANEETKHSEEYSFGGIRPLAFEDNGSNGDFVRYPKTIEASKGSRVADKLWVTDLEDLFAAAEPAVETFTFSPNDEVFIQTENGTKLYVQPESFLDLSGKRVEDSVTLSVQVFDDFFEYAAQGLVTQTTDNNLLQTGGMFHIAATSNGEEVTLDPALPMQIAIPYLGEKVEGMHTYYGEEKKGLLMWNDAAKVFPQFKDASAPKFGKPTKRFHLAIQAYGKASGKAIESFVTKETNENWLDWLEKVNLSGTELENYLAVNQHVINMNIEFEENGSMVFFTNERELSNDVAKQIAEVLQSAPEILDESTRGAKLKDRFYLRFSGSYDKESQRHEKRAVRKYGKMKFAEVDTVSEELLNEYCLNVRSLGYLNCDQEPNLRQTGNTSIRVPEHIQHPRVWILIAGIASLAQGILEKGHFIIKNAPIGRSAKIIVIGEKNGEPVMTESLVVLERKQEVSTPFTRFTYNQLEQVFKPIQVN